MAITWLNDSTDKTKDVVQYGIAEKDFHRVLNANEKYSIELKAFVNKITLKNLKPATWYYYKAHKDLPDQRVMGFYRLFILIA